MPEQTVKPPRELGNYALACIFSTFLICLAISIGVSVDLYLRTTEPAMNFLRLVVIVEAGFISLMTGIMFCFGLTRENNLDKSYNGPGE